MVGLITMKFNIDQTISLGFEDYEIIGIENREYLLKSKTTNVVTKKLDIFVDYYNEHFLHNPFVECECCK